MMSPKIHLVFSAALFYDRLCVYCGIITLEAYQTKDLRGGLYVELSLAHFDCGWGEYLYNISTKSTPQGIDPFASLTITHLVAAALSLLMFFCYGRTKKSFDRVFKSQLDLIFIGDFCRELWNLAISAFTAPVGK